MSLQVNVRLDEADWERLVAALPGESNAERIAHLVRRQLVLLDARRDLAEALRHVEELLAVALKPLREQALQGRGSELSEALGRAVAEMAAVLLSRSEGLKTSPESALPALEAQLAQRWARATVEFLRLAILEPGTLRHPHGVAPEARRVLEQARLLVSSLPPPVAAGGDRPSLT